MKSKNLKVCFVIIMSFAICSLKAQSLQERHQKDMEQRKQHVNEVLLKAKEQQMQQKAERTSEATMPQGTSTANTVQPNIQSVPVQQKKNEIKSQPNPVIKKSLPAQEASKEIPIKENI
jgi:hypothetical protein